MQLLMILFQNYIYFGNNREPIIYIYNKTNMDYISSYRLRSPLGITGGITDMAMFAPDVQPSATSKSVLL